MRASALLSVIASLSGLALFVACSSSTTSTNVGTDAGGGGEAAASTCTGGAVAPASADAHCAGKSNPTSTAACHPDGGAGHDHDAGTSSEGGATDDGGAMEEGYPDTLAGSEGDDDDCKYHVKWSVLPLCVSQDVSFTVTVTKKTDGTPLTGAAPRLEVFLDDTHPAPNTDQKAVESTPGTYTVGPVKFDKAGKWTVRYHFYEDCSDETPDSPHGHVAFFVNVP